MIATAVRAVRAVLATVGSFAARTVWGSATTAPTRPRTLPPDSIVGARSPD